MDDLVALVVGVASYPRLPGWDIMEDRTAKDAIAVTKALRGRGVSKEKIKLLASGKNLPATVEDVPVEPADKWRLEKFITEELGEPPFLGERFLLFWSGHGVEAAGHSETLVITADSLRRADGRRLFHCLGIDHFRTQLQGMTFMQQMFCINACRTPVEWSVGDNDEEPHLIQTLQNPRSGDVRQTRFFAADELKPVTVDSGPEGLSNAFAAAVCDCIAKGEWPPRETEWLHRLRAAWPILWSIGAQEVDATAFRLLNNNIRVIDRRDQRSLVDGALRQVLKWKQQQPGAADVDAEIAWDTTLIDLHARTADRLDLLMSRLEEEVFKPKLVPDGVQRANRWPDRNTSFEKRKHALFEELTYRLTGYRNLRTPEKIIDEIQGPGAFVKVVFIEIDGPCTSLDGPLVRHLRNFWRGIIAEALKRGSAGPCLPLLLIGHIDPEPDAGRPAPLDTTSFYHNAILDPANERRLNPIRGDHLRAWLNDVVPAERFPGRGDLELALATALGGVLIEDVTVRMEAIVDFIASRTPRPKI